MKQIQWTSADANRAVKMGWRLMRESHKTPTGNWVHHNFLAKTKGDGPFKSDREAVEWVVECLLWEHDHDQFHRQGLSLGEIAKRQSTCRKAITLCALGGNSQ